ncbi:3-Deoxy-D-manno-octulosonic-acid transferase family protein, partial [Vibrio parahaemolyticus AQ3810]
PTSSMLDASTLSNGF